jgi:Mn2+/Fe2+ NRAMP family transporter
MFSEFTPFTLIALTACVVLASYVQNLTGFALGLIFLGLVSVFHLLPISVAGNAITLMTLVQSALYLREHLLTPKCIKVTPRSPTGAL